MRTANRSFLKSDSFYNSVTTLDERGTFHCNGGDDEPDHDGGHGTDGDDKWSEP